MAWSRGMPVARVNVEVVRHRMMRANKASMSLCCCLEVGLGVSVLIGRHFGAWPITLRLLTHRSAGARPHHSTFLSLLDTYARSANRDDWKFGSNVGRTSIAIKLNQGALALYMNLSHPKLAVPGHTSLGPRPRVVSKRARSRCPRSHLTCPDM